MVWKTLAVSAIILAEQPVETADNLYADKVDPVAEGLQGRSSGQITLLFLTVLPVGNHLAAHGKLRAILFRLRRDGSDLGTDPHSFARAGAMRPLSDSASYTVL